MVERVFRYQDDEIWGVRRLGAATERRGRGVRRADLSGKLASSSTHRRTGLLIPPSRPDVAAESVLELVADEALRRQCVAHGKQVLGRRFDIHQMVRDLDRTYLQLLRYG